MFYLKLIRRFQVIPAKHMQTKSFRQYFIIVVLVSLAIALTIRFPMIMEMLFDDGGRGGAGSRHHRDLTPDFTRFFIETSITFLVALVMFIMNYFILRPTDKHYPLTAIRIGLAIVLQFFWSMFSITVCIQYQVCFDNPPPGRGEEMNLTS